MPTLSQLVTQIKDEFVPDWSRIRILNHINRTVRALYNHDSARCIFYNTADPLFPMPFLKTVSKQLSYDITSANLLDSSGVQVPLTVGGSVVNGVMTGGIPVTVRRLKTVFIDAKTMAIQLYQPQFRGERYEFGGVNPYWRAKLYNAQFYAVPGVLVDKNSSQAAGFRFLEDPADHGNFFYTEFYYSHPDIVLEQSPLLLDLDIWEDAIIDGVVGYIEDRKNGRSERLQKFQKEWISKWCDDANVGMANRTPIQMQSRECG